METSCSISQVDHINQAEVAMPNSSDIGVAGLAVMGANLARNISGKGFRVSVYNRTSSKIDTLLEKMGRPETVEGCYTIVDFVNSLKPPRKILLMLKAGEVVDHFIDQLLPLLHPGDIIIDGGNSNFEDTQRRVKEAESHDLLYIGAGVSGGEEGALKGPSLMPGGSSRAWPLIEPIFKAIAATADDNSPCCTWIGEGGAGHFVKMVHNGIEYGDMQLICESYQIMKNLLHLQADDIHKIFKNWNRGELSSYLIEITSAIFTVKDDDGTPLIDKIRDTAGQKGTGKWTVIAAMQTATPLSLISEAVNARFLSADKEGRTAAARLFNGPTRKTTYNQETLITSLAHALYAARILCYAQGFQLMHTASAKYGWQLPLADIARIWRGGCIIRSTLLDKIAKAFTTEPRLVNLLLDSYFQEKIQAALPGLRQIVGEATASGIAIPAHSSGLSYYDGLRCEHSPANLLQAQRDYFGAHTFERIDRPAGKFFHTEWPDTVDDE